MFESVEKVLLPSGLFAKLSKSGKIVTIPPLLTPAGGSIVVGRERPTAEEGTLTCSQHEGSAFVPHTSPSLRYTFSTVSILKFQ